RRPCSGWLCRGWAGGRALVTRRDPKAVRSPPLTSGLTPAPPSLSSARFTVHTRRAPHRCAAPAGRRGGGGRAGRTGPRTQGRGIPMRRAAVPTALLLAAGLAAGGPKQQTTTTRSQVTDAFS